MTNAARSLGTTLGGRPASVLRIHGSITDLNKYWLDNFLIKNLSGHLRLKLESTDFWFCQNSEWMRIVDLWCITKVKCIHEYKLNVNKKREKAYFRYWNKPNSINKVLCTKIKLGVKWNGILTEPKICVCVFLFVNCIANVLMHEILKYFIQILLACILDTNVRLRCQIHPILYRNQLGHLISPLLTFS